MKKSLLDAKAKVFKQSVYNKVEELPEKLEQTYKQYERDRQEYEQYMSRFNEDGYFDTGKKYGDYFYENYGQYKDMPIYSKDNKFYLYSNDSYQDLGKLDEKGNVITGNVMTTKEIEDQKLNEAKALGYKENKDGLVTTKEYDDAQKAFNKLKKDYKLSDEELEEFKKTGKLSQKHISIVTNDMEKTRDNALKYAQDLNEGKIQQYTKSLTPSEQLFLENSDMTEDQKKNYINFLTGKPAEVTGGTKGTYFKKSSFFEDGWQPGDILNTLTGTFGTIVSDSLAGIGNWVEGGSDFVTNLLMTPVEELAGKSGKKDVTKDINGQKVVKYKWGEQTFWYDQASNKLYSDSGEEIPYFNIENLIKVQEYNNQIAEFAKFAKEEVNKSNEMENAFLNNELTNMFREGNVLGSKSEALVESAAQTLPNMAVGMAGAGPGTNAAVIFGTTYGQSKAQHIQMGESEEEARLNAFVDASAETISEQFFEGIPGMSTAGWGDDLVESLAAGGEKFFNSTRAGNIIRKLTPVLGEGFEEIISNSISAAEKDFFANFYPEYDLNEGLSGDMLKDFLAQMTTSDSWEQFFGALITSAFLNGGSAVINAKTKNELIKSYAEDNGITFNEAKKELNIIEVGTEYEPAEIKLNDNGTVSFNNTEYTEETLENKAQRLLVMSSTITDEKSLDKLNNALDQLSEAYELLKTSKNENIEKENAEKSEKNESEPISSTKETEKESVKPKVQEEPQEVVKDTQKESTTERVQESEAKLEKLKVEQSKNEKTIKGLEQQLSTLEKQDVNKSLENSIKSQRREIARLEDQRNYEMSNFGMTPGLNEIMGKLTQAKTRLNQLLEEQKSPTQSNEEKINELKNQISELKSKDNTKEIEKLEKEIESEKNTIAEKIEKEDEKITVKPTEENIRSWSQTATEGDYEGVDLVKEISDSLDNTYMPEQNLKNWNKATKKFDRIGYENSFKEFKGKIDSNQRITLQDIMMGQKLLTEAARENRTDDVAYLLTELPMIGTETGQVIQAMSLIKKLTPEGQLKILQRTIDRMKAKGVKGMNGVKLTNDMIETVLNSENQEDLSKNVDAVKELIAEQMQGTLEDKLRAWRYFSMLGNPKTHVRNIVSNVAMYGTRSMKKVVQRTLEGAIAKIAPNTIKERTISWGITTKEIRDYVNNYLPNHPEKLSNDYKYKIESQIEMQKKAFGKTKAGKILQTAMDFNSELLENEDMIFKSQSFKMALREYLTANGMKTVQDIESNPNLFNNAVAYATEQSLEATFQQYSALAAYINQIGAQRKGVKFVLEALLPFKRTPINIGKTGFEYSPVGLLKTITKNSYDLKKGNISVTQYIDNISKGLTGSGLTALGYVLAQMGILTGKADDDDKEQQYLKALNRQEYSINVGDKSITIDWLTPVSVPLLLGTTISDSRNENTPLNLNTLTSMTSGVSNPLVELSFLQSLDTALDSYSQDKIQGVVENLLASYISQYVPTFGGQIAKTIDPTVRTTSVSANSPWSFGERVLRQNLNKIPGLTYLLEPSVDIYGNEVRRPDNVILRAMDNMLNPASIKVSNEDEISQELQELYYRTGKDTVIPKSYVSKKFTYNKEQYLPNAKEYTQMKKTYGKTTYDSLKRLLKTDTYRKASDAEKVKLIENVYDYATDEMKKEFLGNRGIDYKNKSYNIIYLPLDEPVYEENAIKTAIDDDVDLTTARKLNKNKK